ncbi:MAG: hypothetical protein U0S12_01075 [Fimbriimonadales bacterium]
MKANEIEPGEVFLVPLDENSAAPAMVTHVANPSRMLAAFGLVAVPRTINMDGALEAIKTHKTWRPIIGTRGFQDGGWQRLGKAPVPKELAVLPLFSVTVNEGPTELDPITLVPKRHFPGKSKAGTVPYEVADHVYVGEYLRDALKSPEVRRSPMGAPVPGGGLVRYLPGLGLQVWLLIEFLSVIGSTTRGTSAWEIVIGLVLLAVVVITPIRDRRRLLRSLGINALAATAIAVAKVALYVDPHEEMEPTKALVAQASLISAAESWALVALILVTVYSVQVRWGRRSGDETRPCPDGL